MSAPYKMKGFSGFGNSPMKNKDENKKEISRTAVENNQDKLKTAKVKSTRDDQKLTRGAVSQHLQRENPGTLITSQQVTDYINSLSD